MLTVLQDRLKTGRERILSQALSADGRSWDDLLYGGSITISIDSEIRPGILKVTVRRGDAEIGCEVVKRYYRMPVYKISMRVECEILLKELIDAGRPLLGGFGDKLQNLL